MADPTRPGSKIFDPDPSLVWFEQSHQVYKTKFKSLHYWLLRSACKYLNYSLIIKIKLSMTSKRATPKEWTRFITASKVVKIVRDQQPKHLASFLDKTLFTEPRKGGLGKFFDESRTKWGEQSYCTIGYTLWMALLKMIKWDMPNDAIRILNKKESFEYINQNDWKL